MDVVYVLGHGSKWGDNELRYSIRSIAINGIGLGDVYIISDFLPGFINPEKVKHIHFGDAANLSPCQNVYNKLQALFSRTDLQQFLFSSDDHFFIKPVYFNRWPLHYKGDKMPDYGIKGVGDRRYTQTMIDTYQMMKRLNLDTKYYEGHTNKLYTREAWDYLTAHGAWQDMFTTVYGVSTNSPMAAAILKLHPETPCRYRPDIKLHHLNSQEDIQLLKSTNSFSIYDSAVETGVADYLQQKFPHKCRFER